MTASPGRGLVMAEKRNLGCPPLRQGWSSNAPQRTEAREEGEFRVEEDSSETDSEVPLGRSASGFNSTGVWRVKSVAISSQQVEAEREGNDYLHPRKVYVRNIPVNWSKDDIIGSFGRVGKISDVHLPRLPNRAGKVFCFITFSADVVIEDMIAKLNGSSLKGERIFVAQAKEKHSRRGPAPLYSGPIKEKSREREDLRSTLKRNRFATTCKNFVSGKPNATLKSLVSKAWLGISNNLRTASLIQAEMGGNGVFDIEVRDLGNRLLMINCPDPAFERRMIEEDWSWLSSWITMIHGKEEYLSKGGFFKWLCIQGVPIQGWSYENFEDIVERFGTSLLVHPESVKEFSFQKALVLIHTSSIKRINEEVSFTLEDESYQVAVSELEGGQIPPISIPTSSLSESQSESGSSGKGLSDFLNTPSNVPSINDDDINEVSQQTHPGTNGLFLAPNTENTSYVGVDALMEEDKLKAPLKLPTEESERTISFIPRIKRTKKKGGKKKKASKKLTSLHLEINEASDRAIALQTYGHPSINFEEALKICKDMGFNTRGKDDLLREHIHGSLNEVIDHWQTDRDSDNDAGVELEEGQQSSSGIGATDPQAH